MQLRSRSTPTLSSGHRLVAHLGSTSYTPVCLTRNTELRRRVHQRSSREDRSMAALAHATAAQQSGPRQMLQLEDYTLPEWANVLSDHVRIAEPRDG